MIDINKAIATTVRTGKIFLGANNTVKNAKIGKVKLVIVAANCPQNAREDIEYYCRLSDIPLITYNGTSIDLGAVCGKPFMVSALAIRDPGDSDILKLAEAANV
ncbi:MAG: 50S ribosomal protein L30e [Candidatus Bathyarchaeia archaeon]